MRSRRSWPLILTTVVIAWYLVVLLAWALRPMHERMPIGVDYSASPATQLSAEFECNNLFSSEAWAGGDLPDLPPQPEGYPALGLPRSPCATVHTDARRTFALDTAVLLLGLATAAYGARSATRRRTQDAPSSSRDVASA